MKVYKKRPGVVLLHVCNEYLLVSTKDARDYCPYVTQINEPAAEYWELLEDANTIQGLCKRASEKYGKEEKAFLLPALTFMGKLSKAGYLIAEDAQ